MGPILFTDEQRALIEVDTSTFSIACPGAGKTQTIVERFVKRPTIGDRRRGVALVSFTNVAVDEAKSRCIGSPELLRCPNFVGTIDSFINRFVVGPAYTTRTKRVVTFRDSWASVPGTSISVPGVRGQFELDWFHFPRVDQAILEPSRVPLEGRAMVGGLSNDELAALNQAAVLMWTRQVRRGVLDASASRLLAATYLADTDTSRTLVNLLGARFAEMIVDEVQDCSKEDVLVLELLRQGGVRLVLVGDPDQAIYGFRGGSSRDLETLRAQLVEGQRLNGNFRSSPAICAAVDSLRSSNDRDRPVGEHAAVQDPVRVLSFGRLRDVCAAVTTLLDECGVNDNEVVVLAHAAAKARVAAGAGGESAASNNRLVRLANAVSAVRREDLKPGDRIRALHQAQRILRELGSSEDRELSQADYLSKYQLTERAYRFHCLGFAVSAGDPFSDTPRDFRDRLVRLSSSQAQLGWSPSMLKSPSGNAWPRVTAPSARVLKYSTIHGFKGLQAATVVLVIPEGTGQPDGAQDWCSGVASEARRVLYVGASRAQRLLILAIHQSLFPAATETLERDGVPFVPPTP